MDDPIKYAIDRLIDAGDHKGAARLARRAATAAGGTSSAMSEAVAKASRGELLTPREIRDVSVRDLGVIRERYPAILAASIDRIGKPDEPDATALPQPAPGSDHIEFAELVKLSPEQQLAMKRSQPELYRRSIEASLKSPGGVVVR
jgi:hypothetical protein